MSGADDLRTAIGAEVDALSDPVVTRDDVLDGLLAVIGDPVLRLAILNLIGDVTEEGECFCGAIGSYRMEGGPGTGMCETCHRSEKDMRIIPAYVVRPRGEATE